MISAVNIIEDNKFLVKEYDSFFKRLGEVFIFQKAKINGIRYEANPARKWTYDL